MDLFGTLIIISILTLLGIGLWVWQRERLQSNPLLEDLVTDIPLGSAEANSAVLVATGHGHIIHANDIARDWLQLEGLAPDVEIVARLAQPSDNFLNLLAGEGQTSFQLRDRWVEAVSHKIPSPEGARIVMIMRDIKSSGASSDIMDIGLAMQIVDDIGELASAEMSTDQASQVILEILRQRLNMEAGEICLWNDEEEVLVQRSWVGDASYLLTMAESGGVYHLGQGVAGWVAQQKRPLLVHGEHDIVSLQTMMENNPYRSAVSVPLLLPDDFLGTLTLFSSKSGAFRDTHISLLQSVGRAVCQSIRSAALYTRQESRIRDIASVQALAKRGDDMEDSAAIYKALNSRIAKLMTAQISGVFLYEPARQALLPQLPFHGMPDNVAQLISISLPEGSPQRDIWTQQSYWVTNDANDDPLIEAMGLRPMVDLAGIHNLGLFPLQVGGDRIGMMAVSNMRSGQFSPADLDSMGVLATQAAIVVENLRLYQAEQRIDSELVGLQEMTEAIGALPQGGVFYSEVNSRIARLIGVSMSGILLYDDQTKDLVAELPFYGIDDDLVQYYRIPLTPNSIMEELWTEEDVWYSNRVATDPLVFKAGLDSLAEAIGVTKTLVAVMAVGGRRIGVVQLSNKLDGSDFDESDARLARILATQAGAIIENARLYREVQRRADEAESLRRVVELASGVLTSDDALEPMLAEIAHITGSDIVFISVLDQADSRLITHPRWTHGYQLREPVIMDANTPDYASSVAMSGKVFISNNVLADERVLPAYRKTSERYGIEKAVLVPLAVGDRRLGELAVANPDNGRDYGGDDVRILSTIAVQIGSAVERLMLYRATGENLRQRMDELDAIARVSNALTETVDLNHVLPAICEQIKIASGITGVSIALLLPKDRWRAEDRPRMDMRSGDLVGMGLSDVEVAAILRGSEPYIVSDFTESDFTALPENARSAAAIPILYADRMIGVLYAYDDHTNRFDEQAVGFLMTMAAKAAQGYQNAENRREQEERSESLRQRVGQLNRIFELGQLVHSGIDPVTIMEAVAYSVQGSASFDTVIMLLHDESRQMLRRVANAGMPIQAFMASQDREISLEDFSALLQPEFRVPGTMDTFFFPMERSPEWYSEPTKALAVSFEANRSLHGVIPNAWMDGDLLVVRISGQGDNLVGAMVLDRPHNNQRPDRSTAEVLEIFAHQASTMVENTRLFMQSERSAQLEARLNEMLNAVTSTLELPQITLALADGVRDLLPLVNMTLVIANDETGGFDTTSAVPREDGSIRIDQEELLSLQDTALGHAYEARTDQLYLIDQPQDDLTFGDLEEWQASGEDATLLLPLLAGGECLGVLHLGLSDASGLTTEIRQLLSRMSRLVASSIQNARLFNQAVNLQILTSSVVESIQQGIIVMDQAGNVINFNDFIRQRYKWSEQAENRHLFNYSPDWGTFMREELRQVLEDGVPRELIEQMSPNEGGGYIVRNFYLYPLRAGTDIRGAVLLVEDVTERTELEKAIEARANQLAALTEVSTRITASLERDEVIQVALEEIGWIVPSDSVSIWRRVGPYMVLEGASGVPGDPLRGTRVLIRESERIQRIVDDHQVVTFNSDEPLTLNELPDDAGDVLSWMGVPLISQSHVAGMMVLTGSEADLFNTRSEQHVASAFASQVAIALANADLFEQTFERTNEMGIMLEAAQATSLTRNITQVFHTVADLMFSALDMAECAIMMWNEVDNELLVQFSKSSDGSMQSRLIEGSSFDMSKYPARRHAMERREVVVIMDVPDDDNPPYPIELEELREAGYSMRMLVPLIVTNTPIGLIMLQQSVENIEQGVSQQRMRLARALGLQVAVAIENARLSTETNVRFEELLTINSLSQEISSTLNLENMLPIVRDQLPSVTGAEEMYLALYDADDERITFPLAVRNGETFNMPSRQLNTDEVSYIIRNRRPLNLGADYFSIDQIRANLKITSGEADALSYLGVPLLSGESVLGVLAIRDTRRRQAFDINAERVLSTVASQLAAAIQNARLFEQVQASAQTLENLVLERTDELETERDRLDTLYQITSELTRTLDMGQLLDRALGMVSKAVGATDGVIILMDPSTDGLITRAWLDPATIYEVDGRKSHAAQDLANWLIIQNEMKEQIVLVNDLYEQDYWDTSLPFAEQFRSAMAVVLENNDEPVGVMVLLSTEIGAFDDNHLKLLIPAANQVAASINSADLYQLIRDQASRLGNLVRQEKEASQRNSAILESIAEGVMLADANGNIVSFNAAAERILGINRREAEGKPVSTLAGLYGTSAARWSSMIENWSAQMDGTNLMASDEYFAEQRIEIGNRIISAGIAPVTMETGDFLGTVSVFRDITRDVEADRIKSEFIENVSHEFRTPLTPIKGYTDLLLQGASGALTDIQRGMIGTIKDNVDRLTMLVDDVLNIAQLDRSGVLALMQESDLKQIIPSMVDEIAGRPNNVAKQINVTVDVADDLPVIHADSHRLEQIILNLIDNAFKFTRASGQVDVQAQRDGEEHVLVSIADTGVGIPEAFRERVWLRFERYEQHALEMEVAGTGLGLPLVKELVALHGGDVWFESELGQGTTFYLRLPIVQPGYRSLIETAQGHQQDTPESMAGD